MTELPSGCQYTIVYGDQQVTIVEVGGGLRSYVAEGRELLDGYAEDEMASGVRGQPLIPGRTGSATGSTPGTESSTRHH